MSKILTMITTLSWLGSGVMAMVEQDKQLSALCGIGMMLGFILYTLEDRLDER